MRNYKKTDGHRTYYVKIPMQLTAEMLKKLAVKTTTRDIGKWICVDIVKGGYSVPPFASIINTLSKAQKTCDVHNKFHGWSKEEVEKIIAWSMYPENKMTKVKFDSVLDKKQFEKFSNFLAWLKKDKESKKEKKNEKPKAKSRSNR